MRAHIEDSVTEMQAPITSRHNSRRPFPHPSWVVTFGKERMCQFIAGSVGVLKVADERTYWLQDITITIITDVVIKSTSQFGANWQAKIGRIKSLHLIWHSINSTGHIDKVELRRVRLVLGLLTAFLSGLTSRYFPGHWGPLSLAIPPWADATIRTMVFATAGEETVSSA